ncbi:MAG: nuclear transport factor 2 family protein [Myxococcota bacterium]
MTMNTEDLRARWEAYASIWKLEGADAKRSACAAHLDAGCVYTDPLTQRTGHDALIEYMLEFHQQVPGGHFVTQSFKAHNGRSVAMWTMVGGDGAVLGDGISYGEYTEDGTLKTMTGFFDQA